MILSMTGFGKAQFTFGSHQATVEIKSLNSKQLELNLRLPITYRDKEQEIRSAITQAIGRGKVDCYISIENNGASNVSINQVVFKEFYNQLLALTNELNPPVNPDLISVVSRMPEVVTAAKEELVDEEGALLINEVNNALAMFTEFRKHEGEILKNEIMSHIQRISELLATVAQYETIRVSQLRERIEKGLQDLAGSITIDQNRLEQEMIFYIEKLDITEEKVRLKKHLDYFEAVVNDEDAAGKKLGFVSQEIGREINTIGSKANCFEIQQIVVQMKDELEKIKEQLLNIL